jgi:IS5 family transposase
MSQISFSDAEHAGKRKKTRREIFLGEMELVVPALEGTARSHRTALPGGRSRTPAVWRANTSS